MGGVRTVVTALLAAFAVGAAAQETVWGVHHFAPSSPATNLFVTNTNVSPPTNTGVLRRSSGTSITSVALAQTTNLFLRATDPVAVYHVTPDGLADPLYATNTTYGGLCVDLDGSLLATNDTGPLGIHRLTSNRPAQELGTLTFQGGSIVAGDTDLTWSHEGLLLAAGSTIYVVDPVSLAAQIKYSQATSIMGIAAGGGRVAILTREGFGIALKSLVTSPTWQIAGSAALNPGAFGDLASRPVISFVTINLSRPGWGGVDSAPVTIDVRDATGFRVQRATVVPSGGSVTFPTTLRGGFSAWVKGDRWLASVTPVTITDAGGSASLTLRPGDVMGDNVVDLTDFLTLASTYEASPVVPATADLNGDGQCDLQDFLLLAANYEQAGAP